MNGIDKQAEMKASIVKIKRRIERYIMDGHFPEATGLIQQYEQVAPYDLDIVTLKVQLCMKAGEWEQARELLLEGLNKDPYSFNFYFLLAKNFEEEGQYLSAYNNYRNAEYVIENKSQKRELRKAALFMQKQMEKKGKLGMIAYTDKGYRISLMGDKQPVNVSYPLSHLLEKKELLNIVTQNMNTNTHKVLEIECKEGIISRFLSELNLDVLGIDGDPQSRFKWIGIEWSSKVRDLEMDSARYYTVKMNLERIRKLASNYDTIILFPSSFSFYGKYDVQEIVEIVQFLGEKARLQLFISIPCPKAEEERNKYHEVLQTIEQNQKELIPNKTIHLMDQSDKKVVYMVEETKSTPGKSAIIPNGLEVIQARTNIFEVDLSNCVDLNGFHYLNDWQHCVQVLEEYKLNPELTYEESVLKKYYDRFCPSNLEEQYFYEDQLQKEKKPLNEGWGIYPWFNIPKPKQLQKTRIETRIGGSHHFGPNTDEFGKEEFKRLIRTYEKLKKESYHPEIYIDGFPNGYMLRNEDDYRFVISEGQHRLPALAALGYEKILCKFNPEPRYMRITDIADIKKWPHVKNGTFSRNLAKQLFDKYFERRGRQIAKQIGVL